MGRVTYPNTRPGSVGSPQFSSVIQATTKKLRLLGDSITRGFCGLLGAEEGGLRAPIARRIREGRNDIRLIGSLYSVLTGGGGTLDIGEYDDLDLANRAHDGHSGYTLAQLEAAYAGYVTASGQADAVHVMAGTNDLATGRTRAQMSADLTTLLTTIRAQEPTAHVFVSSIPYSGAYSTLRGQYNSDIPGIVAAFRDMEFVDSCGDTTLGDLYSGDTIHLSDQAADAVAARIYRAINAWYPIRSGRVYPRPYRPRAAHVMPRTSCPGDEIRLAADALTDMSSVANWCVAWTQKMDCLAVGAVTGLYSYGDGLKVAICLAGTGTLGDFVLYQDGSPLAYHGGYLNLADVMVSHVTRAQKDRWDFPAAAGTALSTATAKGDAQAKALSLQPDFPRTVRISTAGGWTSSATVGVVISGVDAAGVARTECIRIPAAGTTIEGNVAFATLTSILAWQTPAGWTAGTFAVELGTKLGIAAVNDLAKGTPKKECAWTVAAPVPADCAVGTFDSRFQTYAPTTAIDGANIIEVWTLVQVFEPKRNPARPTAPANVFRFALGHDSTMAAYYFAVDGIVRATWPDTYVPLASERNWLGANPACASGMPGAYQRLHFARGTTAQVPGLQTPITLSDGSTLTMVEALERDAVDGIPLPGRTHSIEMADGGTAYTCAADQGFSGPVAWFVDYATGNVGVPNTGLHGVAWETVLLPSDR